ncbi:MAG: DUF4276 family protein [Magnetococcales bacterium]|nr:DUF4276 family protein [Magnetococcales bacterium]
MDISALRGAYPRIPETLEQQRGYRDPDAIRGGTWEALHRELQRRNYCNDVFPKIEVARNIARSMNPNHNRSTSFAAFRSGLEALLSQP